MILKRLSKNNKDKNSYLKNNLSPEAIQVIDDYSQTKVATQSVKCLCGANTKDEVVAEIDRYGFDITTKLCLSCGLMRSDPYYTEQELNVFYNGYYEKIYRNGNLEGFYQFNYNRGKNEYFFIDKHLNLTQNKLTIYEIGCGTGGCLKYFAENGHTVMGCDLGEEYLNYGKTKGLNLIHGGLDVLKSYGKADLILLNHVLEHFTNPLQALNNMKSLLKPNGCLYIQVPGVFTDYVINVCNYDYLPSFQNAHTFHFSLETLTQIASREQFKLTYGTQYIEALFQLDDTITPIPYNNKHAFVVKNYLLKTEKTFLFKTNRTLQAKIFNKLQSLKTKVVGKLKRIKAKITKIIYL